MALRRIVIVPGNGAGCASANFYETLAAALREAGHEVSLREMPDPDTAKMRIWLPFITDVLHCDAGCVLVGHSSGAVAGLRLAETSRLHGLVAVAVTPTDLGDENERASGYYDAPWNYAAIRANVRHCVQFASTNDPFIPIDLQRRARDGLSGEPRAAGDGSFEYMELSQRSHFFAPQQPEILAAVLRVARAL